jgi:hypothetical protein
MPRDLLQNSVVLDSRVYPPIRCRARTPKFAAANGQDTDQVSVSINISTIQAGIKIAAQASALYAQILAGISLIRLISIHTSHGSTIQLHNWDSTRAPSAARHFRLEIDRSTQDSKGKKGNAPNPQEHLRRRATPPQPNRNRTSHRRRWETRDSRQRIVAYR